MKNFINIYYLPVVINYNVNQDKEVIKIILDKTFMEKLKIFGLNSYEVRVWTALLSRGVSTAGELSEIANVPRSRTYDILESLEKKGFILQKIGKPIKYIAIPPEEVIERVKKHIRNTAAEREKMLENIKNTDIFEELRNLHNKGIDLIDPSDISASIKGKSAILDQVSIMLQSAEKYVYIASTPKTIIYLLPRLKSLINDASKRGVKIKILVATNNKEEINFLNRYIVGNTELLINPSLKSRFFISDGKEILFMLMDEGSVHEMFDPGIWVSSPMFASVMARFFEVVWKESKIKLKK